MVSISPLYTMSYNIHICLRKSKESTLPTGTQVDITSPKHRGGGGGGTLHYLNRGRTFKLWQQQKLIYTCHMTQLIINSFGGKANYYGTHVVQKKKSVVLCRENIDSKQLTLYDQETTDQYVVDYKVLTV